MKIKNQLYSGKWNKLTKNNSPMLEEDVIAILDDGTRCVLCLREFGGDGFIWYDGEMESYQSVVWWTKFPKTPSIEK